jgi:hypothetical protein
MQKLAIILSSVIFLTGCSKMESLSPDNDDREKEEKRDDRQEQQAFVQKQAKFQVVKAYYDSLEQTCNNKGQLTTDRHQKLDKQFHQAVSQFRSHDDGYHDGDDDHEGHKDGYEDKDEGDHDDDDHEGHKDGYEDKDEGDHDDDDKNGEEESHENHHEHDSDHDDSFEQKERELEDKVDKMVNNHCHNQS